MEFFTKDIMESFTFERFKKSFLITWFYLMIGLILFLFFLILSGLIPKESFFYYFLQNIGMFILFTSLLMSYAGVYRINQYENAAEVKTSVIFRDVSRRSHYLLGVAFITLILIGVIIFIEVGITALSYIPYAGPVLIAVLTIPFLMINVACVIMAFCIFAVMPAVISASTSFKEGLKEMLYLIRNKWLNVIIYLVISLSFLFLSMLVVYYLVIYSVGITWALQWKINVAYPQVISNMAFKSYLVELIRGITPKPDPIGAYQTYGQSVFTFIDILRYCIAISYMFVFSFVVSFPFAAYFNISSRFFSNIKKGE